MKAEIKNFQITKKKQKVFSKKNRFLSFLFYVFLIMNIVCFLDQGAAISIQKENKFFSYGMIFSFSYIGNMCFSLFPITIIHKICKKFFLLFFLFLLCLFSAIYTTFLYLQKFNLNLFFACKIIIGLSQSFISIFSNQWCVSFFKEKEKLNNVCKIQLVSFFGLLLGFLFNANINYLPFYIQSGVSIVLFFFFCFIPSNYLENKTLIEKDNFLRSSGTDTKKEIIENIFIIIVLGLVLSSHFFNIFGIMFYYFPYENSKKTVEIGDLVIFFSLISFFITIIGIVLGGLFTFILSLKVLLIFGIIFTIGNFCLYLGYFIRKGDLNDYSITLLLGINILLSSASLPFIFGIFSNLFGRKKSRLKIFSLLTFMINGLGLLFAPLLISYFEANFFNFLFISAIFTLVLFSIFLIVISFLSFVESVSNSVSLTEYQILLIISTAFGKFSLFIWDDCINDLFESSGNYNTLESPLVEEDPNAEIAPSNPNENRVTFSGALDLPTEKKNIQQPREPFSFNQSNKPLTNTSDPDELFEKKES